MTAAPQAPANTPGIDRQRPGTTDDTSPATTDLTATLFQLERVHEAIRHLTELLSRAITILLTADMLILGYGVSTNKGALILAAGMTPLAIWAAIHNTGRRARPLLQIAIHCEQALPVQVPRLAASAFPLIIATRTPQPRPHHNLLDLLTTRQIPVYLLLLSAGQILMFAIATLRYDYSFL